jgi:beta-glucosidase
MSPGNPNAGAPPAGRVFPPGFLWGAATASYQIEGSPLADDAGESIWHRFSHTPGKTEGGQTGDVACDSYRRWREDVRLLSDLNLKAYRFSISWPRVLPEGVGRANPAGLAYYGRLVDALLERGITPLVTLFHWDYPQALWDRGGLLNRDSAEWFGEYAATVFRALGDRVMLWLTLNEPAVFTDCGLRKGVHAPGLQDWDAMIVGGHNLMRGHGRAAQALRAVSPRGRIGVAFALGPNLPERDTAEDRAAARRNGAYSRRFCDPIHLGEYPPRFLAMFAGHMPAGFEKDMDLIHQPLDLIGVNYYSKWRVTWDPGVPFLASRGVPAWREQDGPPGKSSFYKGSAPPVSNHGVPLTPIGWAIHPEGLRETLVWARQRYGDLDFYVTENGAASDETHMPRERELQDDYRIRYLRDHFLAAHEAIGQGVRLKGYMVWTLMDNFEWAAGYRVRCGLAYTDFRTQERIPKASARWYAQVAAANGL